MHYPTIDCQGLSLEEQSTFGGKQAFEREGKKHTYITRVRVRIENRH